eukprot:scaffold19439_cov145-Skeletonema_marinoi.AAC.2
MLESETEPKLQYHATGAAQEGSATSSHHPRYNNESAIGNTLKGDINAPVLLLNMLLRFFNAERGKLSLFFYARNLGYGVRLSGLCAYVDTCVSIVG